MQNEKIAHATVRTELSVHAPVLSNGLSRSPRKEQPVFEPVGLLFAEPLARCTERFET